MSKDYELNIESIERRFFLEYRIPERASFFRLKISGKESMRMNEATINSLTKVHELVKEEKHDPRQKFARAKEAMEIYHVSRPSSTE